MPVKIGGINNRTSSIANDINSSGYLQVNACGIFEKTAESSLTIRPNGRKDYQLIIISNGHVTLKYNKKSIIVSKGEMIIIPPFIRNEYRYSDPVDAMWIHFTGVEVKRILKNYKLVPMTKYTVSNTGHFFSYAERIIREFQLKKTGYMNNCNGYLLNTLTLVKRRIEAQSTSNENMLLNSLSLVTDEMQTNFADNNDVSYYAKMCNLGPSRFTHLFTKKYGVSPHRYLLNIRITQAKYLLSQTNIQISEIAKSVGYEDPFYFSRTFKKNVGLSPIDYRHSNSKQP